MEGLKKNSDFQAVFSSKTKKSCANKYLVVNTAENNLGFNRLGISVSKKVGNSVVRHRIKRLIKESYRLHEEEFNSGLDLVIVARVNANTVEKIADIENALFHAFKHLNLFKI